MIKLLLISLITVCSFICIVTIIGGIVCIITLKKLVNMKNTSIKTNQHIKDGNMINKHNPSEIELNLARVYLNCVGNPESDEVKTIKTVLDRLTPKKPDLEGDGYDDNGNLIYDTYICPNCEARYETDYDIHDHCPRCGQKFDRSDIDFDWSEDNE